MSGHLSVILSGKIALVTGGTKGVGKAIATRLSDAGAADLSKPQGTQKVVEEILAKYGRLDILINNLGSSETPGGGFAVLTDNDWETILQTNLLAPVRLDKSFLPGMIGRKAG